MAEIGYQWLSRTYNIHTVHPLAVQSEIGRNRSTSSNGDMRFEVYPESYRPEDTFAQQVAFAFKYEGIHLEFLARLFSQALVKQALEQWITREPTGSYARRACFLYEWLRDDRLDTPNMTRGNYIDALDPELYLVGTPINCPRWRVRDNLPGNRNYCPTVRRTTAIQTAEAYDLPAKLAKLETDFGVDLILRSAVWLTVKESRASFLIEREQDKEDRIRRFAAVMENECGQHDNPFTPETLSLLQRGILGDMALRYGLRRSPVYVGHSTHYQAVVDYIAPHWEQTHALLSGLAHFLERSQGASSIVRAAVASFGFVYIHPMADGNGRISRFLINDILRRDGSIPAPIILPVSATIADSTQARAAYDKVLERISRPLMRKYADQYQFGEPTIAEDGVEHNLYFSAYEDALPAWRYPDLTAHAEYLAKIIDTTLTQEMRKEAHFLKANDQARTAIKQFLEVPDNELDSMIRSIRQNGNALSNQLCKRYPIFVGKSVIGEKVVDAVKRAFGD
jgi:hypothetical protein